MRAAGPDVEVERVGIYPFISIPLQLLSTLRLHARATVGFPSLSAVLPPHSLSISSFYLDPLAPDSIASEEKKTHRAIPKQPKKQNPNEAQQRERDQTGKRHRLAAPLGDTATNTKRTTTFPK